MAHDHRPFADHEAAEYRQLADVARNIAARFHTDEIRARLRDISEKYERFARKAEQVGDPGIGGQPI